MEGLIMWRNVGKKDMKTLFVFVVFLAYILVVLNLTVIRLGFRYEERQLNLALFVELIDIYRTAGVGLFLRLFLGNIGWFVPFGFLLPLLLKEERFISVVAMGFLFSLMIEVLQFALRKGVAELDDLILNVLGTAIGYCMFKLFQRVVMRPDAQQ